MKTILSLGLSCLLSAAVFAENTPSPQVGCPTIQVIGTPVNCYGGNTGSVQLNITSGSGDYTINWSTGASAVYTLSNLTAGTYTVNVKDNVSGCTVFGAYVVNQPSPISLSHTVVNVNCHGALTGQVDLTVSGGTGPFTYDWTNYVASPEPQDLTNVAANTYTVTVTDSKGCTAKRTAVVTQPNQPLSSSETHTNVSCNGGSNAAINLTVWGGTFPYSYNWNSGFSSSEDLNNISAGAYTVIITDSKGCSKNQNVTITEPNQLTTSVSLVNEVDCFGNATGNLSSTTSGGSGNYSYSWQSATNLYSINSPNLNNIPEGTYQINVVDSLGCTATNSMYVPQPSPLVISATQVDVNCYGESTGSIDQTISGGSSPYTSNWNSGFALTEDLTNIPAGIYTVITTDVRGCTKTLTREILQPAAPISASIIETNVNCYGDLTGAMDLTVEGGTAPYTFGWTDGATTEDISNLAAGNYSVDITDSKGCFYTIGSIITQPLAPLTSSSTHTDVICFGETNGTVDVTVQGGTAPYYFTWQNSTYLMSSTTEDLINLPANTYAYAVTDSKGCTTAGSETVSQPTQLAITLVGQDILCFGGNNGSVDLTVTGGVLPYTFAWSNGATSEDIANLPAGTYDILVTDANNCTITGSITLTEPAAPLSYTWVTEDAKCNNSTDGSIDLSVDGGTPPYNFDWSNGDTTAFVDNIGAGVYSFLVTDFNGCTVEDSMEIFEPDALVMNETITDVTCFGLSDGIIDVNPTGGTTPYTYVWYDSQFALSAQSQDLINFPSDTFQLELTDSNGCFYQAFWFIPQPELLDASFTSDDVNCAGGSDGSILVDVVGGNGSNTFLWSNGATTEDLVNVPIGTYNFMVTDSKGCQDSLSVQIFEPDPVNAWFDITDVSCKDQHDGAIETHPFGGTGNFTYVWSTGSIAQNIDDLPTANYSIVITDVLGCTHDTTVFVDKLQEFCIFPPTAFTPNGDAYNDTWYIENLEVYPNIQLSIFNKWGNIIHQQEGLYEPWDGLIDGKDAPAETYYYILNLNNPDEDKINGSVTILR